MGGSEKHHKNKKQKQNHESIKADKKAKSGAADVPSGAAEDGPGPSGRKWTLSVAIPGNLLDSYSSIESAVCAAAQIARAAAAFQVDELIVYDDSPAATAFQPGQPIPIATVTPGTALLARILQFLDTPPHLRLNLYGDLSTAPRELQLAAALPSISPPHHARPSSTWIPYREGVVLKSEPGAGSYVDVGLDRMVWLEHDLPESTRVTVHLGDVEPATRFMAAYSETMIMGTAVPPAVPRERLGLYWGYTLRVALGLQRVFREAAVGRSGGYDLTIGSSPSGAPTDPTTLTLPVFKHALLVFGGGSGGSGSTAISSSLVATSPQQQLAPLDLDQLVSRVPDWEHKMPQDVFNLYLNTTPHLGSLRLRTEDAIPIALSYLITPVLKYGKQ